MLPSCEQPWSEGRYVAMTTVSHYHSFKPVNQNKRHRIVQVGATVAAGLLAISQPAWGEQNVSHEVIELSGLALIFLCVLGRL